MEYTVSRKLEKKLKDAKSIQRYFGELAPRIRLAISWIILYSSLGEIPNTPPTRRHKLVGDYEGCWALDLNSHYRMVIKPDKDDMDPNNIKHLEIIDIVDYH